MSKLIDKLRRISQGASPPIGFRTGKTAQNQSMLLLASLRSENITEVKEAFGEVDALAVSLEGEGEGSILRQLSEVAGEIPWGGWLVEMTDEKIKDLKEAGADFFVFGAEIAATAVRRHKIGKILHIDPAWSDNFIRTLEQLPVDAVLLDHRESHPLTLLQLMQCQRLVALLTKPLLVAVSPGLAKEELESLWEVGISGVVIGMEKNLAGKFREWRQVITTLPAIPRRQRRKAEPLLPPSATPSPAEEEEEEESI